MALKGSYRPDTVITHAGLDPEANHGIVNPPVYHASTITFPSVAAWDEAHKPGFKGTVYGRHGTPRDRERVSETRSGAVVASSAWHVRPVTLRGRRRSQTRLEFLTLIQQFKR